MKRGFTLVELIIIGMILVILAAILLPVFARPDRSGQEKRGLCQSNLKLIALATLQYAGDHADRFPAAPAGALSYAWSKNVQPYLKRPDLLYCPTAAGLQPERDMCRSDFSDYWMNKRLLGTGTRDVVHPGFTMLLGDGSAPHAAIDSLPTGWMATAQSPLSRHLEGANYAFADGHVKWMAASDIKSPFQIDGFRFDPYWDGTGPAGVAELAPSSP